MIYMATKL